MDLIKTENTHRSIHNYYIDLFRFCLMFWIVLFHYTVQYNSLVPDKTFSFPLTFENGGSIGVALFFMVSGFFMTKSLMTPKDGAHEYGVYIVKRYLRLWIPYIIACVIIYIWLLFYPIEGRTVNLATFIANVSCIIHPGFDRVDNAHWFLADLLILQLLLGLILFIHTVKHRKMILNSIFTIVMILQVFPPPILSGISKELFEVLLGVHFYMMINNKNTKTFILSVIGLMVVLYLSIELFAGVLTFLILVYLGEKHTPVSSFKYLKKILQFAGTISFYWYLVHQNIGYSIMYYYIPNGTVNECWLFIPVLFTLLISLVVYFADKYLSKLIHKRISFLNK